MNECDNIIKLTFCSGSIRTPWSWHHILGPVIPSHLKISNKVAKLLLHIINEGGNIIKLTFWSGNIRTPRSWRHILGPVIPSHLKISNKIDKLLLHIMNECVM